MGVKQNEMKIVGAVILHEGNTDVYIEGLQTFLVWHEYDEEAMVDYNYLYRKVAFTEDWIHDKLIYHYEDLRDVTIDVKQWEIGETIYTVKNHQKKRIKKTISTNASKSDGEVFNTRGYILSIQN